MNGSEIKGLKLAIPVKKPRREERCDSCYWADHAPDGNLACHGTTPTVNLLQVPHPTQPGQMMLKPLTCWAPVRPEDYCRLWEKRDGAPLSAIPNLGGDAVVEHPVVADGD